jgi:sugar (pentulose or hexulose) kinase
MKHVAVIDLGKTNAKLALVDLPARAEVAVLTMPNRVLSGPPYPHFDTDGIWAFVKAGLARFQADHGIDGISITTHGACAALLAADGRLAAPVLDYEHSGPDTTRAAYDLIRPAFADTGSAALPMGLNLGAQLYWQLQQDPGLQERIAQVVTWPQYWGFRLTGQTATDLCSLGCHTDLWNPSQNIWSDLPDKLGIAFKMAPARKPADVLGTLQPALQAELGLGPVPVLTGIHDSNASLVPHLTQAPPFSVVSTGTWVIAMAMGGKPVRLDPDRDMLVNVNALGQPVPSARFMGGREYEIIRQGHAPQATKADAAHVLDRALMLLPSVVAGSGPFPQNQMRWTHPDRSDAETEIALGYYLALMTAECLANIGADGPTLIEGPFAVNPWFRQMLAAATARPALASAARTGTAIGAAMLFGATTPKTPPAPQAPDVPTPVLSAYAAQWAKLARKGQSI